ncbi:MAG: hypothetical protein HY348_06460 [Nitrospira defluvii]|nr:hypothetical protein [Nitrospira defluvii]
MMIHKFTTNHHKGVIMSQRVEVFAEKIEGGEKETVTDRTADYVRAHMVELKKEVLAQRLQEQANDAEALAAV